MNDELIIIRATIALNPEKLEEFRKALLCCLPMFMSFVRRVTLT